MRIESAVLWIINHAQPFVQNRIRMFKVFHTLRRTLYELADGVCEFVKEILFDEVSFTLQNLRHIRGWISRVVYMKYTTSLVYSCYISTLVKLKRT
jgi:hypothetical protein